MHVPKPLGGYPLILRTPDVVNPRLGELLFNYDTDDLLYMNKHGQIKSITEDIFNKIIATKLENTDINIVKAEADVEGEESVIPSVEDRKVNTFYMVITDRKLSND